MVRAPKKFRKKLLRDQYEWSSIEFAGDRSDVVVWCHPRFRNSDKGFPLVLTYSEAQELSNTLRGYCRAVESKRKDAREARRKGKRK